ncbi:MAG: glycosyltransferase family 1 protein [Anaerolineae bacterium]|nr:glycosyltransferase family 1 protein [Anaerolineae bacterium]
MKITILAVGTRGDVQPYVALAKGLQSAGYEVRLAAPTTFESFVTGNGLPYHPLNADYYQLMDSPEGQALKSGNPIRVMQHMKTSVYPIMRRLMDDSWAAAQGSDAIVFHPKVLVGAHLGEALRIPVIATGTVPLLTPTSAFPAVGVVNRDLGPFNKFTYAALGLVTKPFSGMIEDWRQEKLGLPARSSAVKGLVHLNGQRLPILYCYSRHLLPVPPDWDESVHVTGFWVLEEGATWQPPAELQAFLESGAPPVYIGFGSMIANDPQTTTRIVLDAVRQAGVRAVLASGWGGLRPTDVPEGVFLLKEAPHDWLFPRMAAVVHHGGAGTTAAGLRAGKPTLICPFIADQPFWGARVAALGAGPEPIAQKHLTADALAAALMKATRDRAMSERAEALGALLRGEDGVGNAVRVITQVVKAAPVSQSRAVPQPTTG